MKKYFFSENNPQTWVVGNQEWKEQVEILIGVQCG